MRLARYRVDRLIQDLMVDADGAAAFARDPEPAFAKYGLGEEERAALRDDARLPHRARRPSQSADDMPHSLLAPPGQDRWRNTSDWLIPQD